MSTGWGLQCKDCDSCTGIGMTSGRYVLSNLAKLAPHIKAIRDHNDGYIDIQVVGWYEDINLLDWLYIHGDHNLEIYNEYEEYYSLETGNNHGKIHNV